MGFPFRNACNVVLFLTSVIVVVVSLQLELKLNSPGQQTSQKIDLVCFPTENEPWKDKKFSLGDRNLQYGKIKHSEFGTPVGIIDLRETARSLGSYNCYYRSDSKKRRTRQAEDRVKAKSGTCPPGYKIEDGECYQCLPGTYGDGESEECVPCPKNTYMPSKEADTCIPCPGNRKTLDVGAESEKQCLDLGSNAKANARSSPNCIKILMIGIIVLLLILCVIVAILYCACGLTLKLDKTRRSRKKRHDDSDTEQLLPSKKDLDASDTVGLRMSRLQDSGSDSTEDHIYEGVKDIRGHSEDSSGYEVPLASDVPPPVPGRARIKSKSAEKLTAGRRSSEDDNMIPKTVMLAKTAGSGDHGIPPLKRDVKKAFLPGYDPGFDKNITAANLEQGDCNKETTKIERFVECSAEETSMSKAVKTANRVSKHKKGNHSRPRRTPVSSDFRRTGVPDSGRENLLSNMMKSDDKKAKAEP